MSKRQIQNMLRLMASGEPVELTSPMASVKKLSRLAFVAQQFGYEYADVRQGGGRDTALKMMIVPDPSPQARARAAQNWAQFPNAGDGVSLPPLVPDALELLKARIQFDLTGKSAQKRMGWAAVGGTAGCAVVAVRAGGDGTAFAVAGVLWVILMAILGIGYAVTRKRNAKFAARLQAAGFAPITDETGRVRYLPPGAYAAQQPPGAYAPGPYAQQQPAGPYAQQQPAGPYAQQQPAGPYAAQQPAGPYVPQQPAAPYAPGPYAAQPQAQPGPYTPQQPPQPYGRPPQPYAQPQPYPQQNPHWQPPQH